MPARVIQLTATGKHSVNETGKVRHYVTKDAVVCAAFNTSAWPVKLCRVAFGKDSSVYVSFPYLTKSQQGVLSVLETPNDHAGPYTYDLAKDGMVVDRHVKFAHHASGEVHFSDTGLGKALPERHSYPLASDGGHLFQLHAYWLGGFEVLKKPKAKDLYLKSRFDGPPFAVLVEGHWWRKSHVADRVIGSGTDEFTGPRVSAIHQPSGEERAFFFLSLPGSPLPEHVLALAVSRIPMASGTDVPSMVFLGGIGPAGDDKTGGLSFLYPVTDTMRERMSRP